MYFYQLLSSHALTTSYLQSNRTNYFYHLPFSVSHSTKKNQFFPGGQGPDSFISYKHTKHMLHFLRSIHCKLDILCIVKTLSSAYHEAKLVLITNLLPHFNSSDHNRLFQLFSAFPFYSFITSLQYPQALLLRSSQHITLQILHQFQHFSSLVISFPIITKNWIIQ